MRVFPHQQAVYSELVRTARTFFSPHWRALTIRPRFSRLVIGESGCGKSFIVRALAEELSLPLWNACATTLLQTKFADSFLVVAAGAFQDLWEQDRKTAIGFGDRREAPPSLNLRRLAETLPTELTNRFAPPPLAIPPMVGSDYEAVLAAALTTLPPTTKKIAAAVAAGTINAAIRDRLGCRWLEQVFLETAARLNLEPQVSSKNEPGPPGLR